MRQGRMAFCRLTSYSDAVGPIQPKYFDHCRHWRRGEGEARGGIGAKVTAGAPHHGGSWNGPLWQIRGVSVEVLK